MGTSVLATDGYKFSMAEAGWPLRREVFYYSHRHGGSQLLPVDPARYLESLWPVPSPEDYGYLAASGYEMGAGFKAAMELRDRLVIHSLPKGAWFLEREPILTIEGPSALVSWIEPLLLMLNFRIQVATLAVTDPDGLARAVAVVACEAQRRIALETLDSVGARSVPIRVDAAGYQASVQACVRRLVEIVGDPERVFEVGMRAATCLEQHELALDACRSVGVTRTSNVWLAGKLGMVPVGTMGHEHVQRFGNDRDAFRAMRERRPGRASFLLDTYDTLNSGLPEALDLIAREPDRRDSIRYDSGDKVAQYLGACARARARGLRPVHILEDGFDEPLTRRFEELRAETGVRPEDQIYGYGGHIVARPSPCPLGRDRVSAVYKLSLTGETPTMKFADEPGGGKESVPGVPVVFRRVGREGPLGIVGQAGETPPEGYVLLTGGSGGDSPLAVVRETAEADRKMVQSDATRDLTLRLRSLMPSAR